MAIFWFALGLFGSLAVAAPLAIWGSRRAAARARRLGAQLLRSERLAELGTLTGGLAHEIKNPLATFRINLQLLAEDWSDSPDDPADLQRRSLNKLTTLTREADRLETILEDFLRFAGQHELDVRRIDLNAMVGELLDFYEPQAAAGRVQLRRGMSADPLPVRLDGDLFKQAVLNLLINAQQAMAPPGVDPPPGGELLVRTWADRESACLEIADTGPGIAPDKLGRIFHAYYSTKRGGTGLGLPTTRRIVEEHGGTIDVHSDPGRGTSFTIRIPLASEQAGK